MRTVDTLQDIQDMARGAVLAEGSMAELQSNQEVVDAYLGGGGG